MATISGSGSALVALGPRDRAQAVAEAMASALRAEGQEATGRVLLPVTRAPRALPVRGPAEGPAER